MLAKSRLLSLGAFSQGMGLLRGLASSATLCLPELPPFEFKPPAYTGPSKEEVLATRKQFLSPAIFHHFKKPVMIVDGKMQYLFDETGRRYLDAFAGIVTVSVGHCHPKVNEAIIEQTLRLQHTTTIYLHDQVALYAKELAERMPGDLKVCYFVNSGSEANDMAITLARLYTGNYDLLCLRNAYHGLSEATMGLLGQHTWKVGIPQGFGVHHALNPDPYRGVFDNDGPAYARDVKDLIQSATPGKVAGFIHETIQGVGGATPLADGYLPEVYKMVREAGGVCIADEVQTGFGRTGSHYWGFETQGVVPDIVTMAKGIGNGLPLAAVVTTPQIAEVLARRLHFNTFGGNPVCSAGGRAVLRVVDEENIQQNAAEVGDHLMKGLRRLQASVARQSGKHDIIGDVRGQGLMVGVELVKDRITKEPATAEVAAVFEACKDMGLLLGKGGLAGNVFRIKPPMCITKPDMDFLLEVMDTALAKLVQQQDSLTPVQQEQQQKLQERQGLVGEDAAVFEPSKQSAASWAVFFGLLGGVSALLYVTWVSPGTGVGEDFVSALESVFSSSEATMVAILAVFAVVHSGLAYLRPYGEGLIGARAYRVVFALASLPLAVAAVVYFINHRYDGVALWNVRGQPFVHEAVWGLSFLSFFFLYPSTFNILEVAAVDEPKLHMWETGVMRITRHPQMLGQLIWCLAHTLWVGSSFMVVTSLGLMAHHLLGCWHGDYRLKRKYGEAFEVVKARTSTFPFQAVWEGRQQLPADYYKEFLRMPYFFLVPFSIGCYLAHPLMQQGSYWLGW
ncbi:hypothetical protein N2152v2_006606 [Parachlorella kessleri]